MSMTNGTNPGTVEGLTAIIQREEGGHCYCWCHPNAGAIGCSPCCDAEDNYLPPSKRDAALPHKEEATPCNNHNRTGAGMIARYLVNHLQEAARVWMTWTTPVVFRDRDGVERPIAKVKVNGRDKIVICEDMNG